MNCFIRSPYIKVLCCYLILFMAGLIPVPETAWASFIYYQSEKTNELDPESLEVLQTVLENALITEKLSELGLTEKEIIHRIEQLSPEERQIVLEKLESVQAGGQFEVLVVIILICLIYMLVVSAAALAVGITKIPEGLRKVKKKREKSITFHSTTNTYFAPYEGEIKVLKEKEPEGSFIHIGRVCIEDFVSGANKEKRGKILLRRMKEKAADQGANTIGLHKDEPIRQSGSLCLSWCAEAYRTQDIENTQ